MWDEIASALGLGREGESLGSMEMALRAVVVYVSTLAMVQIGEKRLFASLRRETQSEDLSRVREAKLERSGEISFVLREKGS